VRVLLFGASGQLGTSLQKTAPTNIVLLPYDRTACDISLAESVQHVIDKEQPSVVINAAAYTAVDKAESDAEMAFAINAVAPGVMAAACATRKIPLVHISTDFVFGSSQGKPFGPDDMRAPSGVYAKSKMAGEDAVLFASPDNLLVRTAWVYAATGTNFVKTMLRLMASQPQLRVIADQLGTPTHAHALAKTIWALVEVRASGAYHCTDAGAASWYDFAIAIQEEALAAGLLSAAVPVIPIRTEDYPTPAKRPGYSVLNCFKTWELLGASARHWRVELRDMIAELKDQVHG
jgi:dTDP-4-dehydrorhamnose reductase